MLTKRLVLVAIALVSISACVHAGPAQDVLADLAGAARSERIVSGVTTIGVGVAVGVASGIFLMGTEFGVYGLIAGGVIAVPGIVLLVLPSSAEQEYAQSGQSEIESALALERLADQGRRDRFLSGAGNVAAGVAALIYPINLLTPHDSLYSALASFGMAAYDFLIPSREEAAYDRYAALAKEGT
jgi:hypothetical protein